MSAVIEPIRDDTITALLALHRALSKDPKAVVVLVHDQDGCWDVICSDMTIADLCAADKRLSLWTGDKLMGR